MEHIWEVVVADADRQGNPRWVTAEVLVRGSEDEARRVYRDRTAEAGERNHAYVALRRDGADVETWPQPTGWTV
jgi:hypothetical protein